jgi:hypothetical protein
MRRGTNLHAEGAAFIEETSVALWVEYMGRFGQIGRAVDEPLCALAQMTLEQGVSLTSNQG